MKRTVRALVLLVGLLGAYVAAAVPTGPVSEGGPVCPYKGCGGRY